MDERDFGERYYREDFGRPYQPDEFWLSFFAGIADLIVREIAPRRVLDAGCAMGFLVEALRRRGVEAYGVDVSAYAIAHVSNESRPFCRQANITDEIGGRYDLITCIEVVPHLALGDAERAVANFCRHADDILFSVRPYGPGALHGNTAPPEHWAGVFARHGFYRDFAFDAAAITASAGRYRKGLHSQESAIAEYERHLVALRSERDADRSRREFAEATIANMQRSWFWKARTGWQRAKALLISATPGAAERPQPHRQEP
jgi:SAM-dependent methyltransferase